MMTNAEGSVLCYPARPVAGVSTPLGRVDHAVFFHHRRKLVSTRRWTGTGFVALDGARNSLGRRAAGVDACVGSPVCARLCRRHAGANAAFGGAADGDRDWKSNRALAGVGLAVGAVGALACASV